MIAWARWLALVFFSMSSLYGVLVASPFAYHQFIRPHLLKPLVWAVTFYDALFLGVLSVTILSLLPDVTSRRTRLPALGYITVCGTASAALFVWPLETWLVPGNWTLALAAMPFLPLIWLAAIDIASSWSEAFNHERPASDPSRILTVGALSSGVVWITYAGLALWRARQGGVSAVLWARFASESLLIHLTVFGAIAWLLVTCAACARRSRRRAQIELLLAVMVLAAWVFALVNGLLFPALALYGFGSSLFALAFACAMAATWCGIVLRRARRGVADLSGLELFFLPMVPPVRAPLWWLIAVPVAAHTGLALSARMDWGFLLQKTSVLVVWLWAWSIVFLCVRHVRRVPLGGAAIASLCVLTTYQAFRGVGHNESDRSRPASEEYAAIDASFKTLDDTLARRSDTSADVFSFLIANTNIDSRQHIEPTRIDFSDVPDDGSLPPVAGKPNIFLFVVDSLRPDYLSPFNETVTFTPRIAAFGGESLVFRNAYTRYGGTGLAVPSIWSGSLLPHRQYVTPFEPMNALARLVDREGYRSVVSLDSIMGQLVRIGPNWRDVHPQARDNQGDLCETVQRMQRHIDATSADPRPIFGYALPQNVHRSYVESNHNPAAWNDAFMGFDAATAAQVQVVDTCFGSFLDFLRTRGLYDNSIVVLTADHGDSLGEDGRWGHSYTGFPEIFRVPLLIHVPTSMADAWKADVDALAFSTDITPTLYALLGHPVRARGGMFGTSLLSGHSTLRERREQSYLVASSYGAVYGLLSDNGRYLYVLDTINDRDYAWDMTGSVAGRRLPLNSAERAIRQRMIVERVAEIAAFFNFRAEL